MSKYNLVMLFCVSLIFVNSCSIAEPNLSEYQKYANSINKGDLIGVKLFVRKYKEYSVRNISVLGKMYNPLEMASLLDKQEIVSFLLENKADPNAISPATGNNIIFQIVIHQGLSSINEMLRFGLDVNVCDKDGYSVISTVAMTGNDRVLESMLPFVTNINFIDRSNSNALFYAVMGKNIECVRLLVEKGVDVNHIDDDGNTALMYAVGNENTEICQYLLKHGADKSIVNKEGFSAKTIAVQVGIHIDGL